MKYKRVWVEGHWNDTKEPFFAQCQIGMKIPPDDDDVFYFFDWNETLVGNKGDFTVTKHLPIFYCEL
jgi:hypothetical protein